MYLVLSAFPSSPTILHILWLRCRLEISMSNNNRIYLYDQYKEVYHDAIAVKGNPGVEEESIFTPGYYTKYQVHWMVKYKNFIYPKC